MQLPNGATLDIASTYGTVSVMSALTNAASAVGTLAGGHSVAIGDLVEITSGWGDIDGQIAKAAAVATNDITFGGIDTTGTRFPAGTGIGSVREITAWTQVPVVLDLASSGGELQTWPYQPLSSFTQRELPTVTSPVKVTFKVDAQATASNAVLRAAAKSRSKTAVKITLPDGGLVLWNAIISMTDNPEFTVNVGMTYTVTLSLQAPVTRY